MKVAILDVETTGLDSTHDEITEIAYVIIDAKTEQIIKTYSTLFKVTKPIPENVEKLTHISNGLLENQASHVASEDKTVANDLNQVDLIVAHNADFDRQFVQLDWDIKPDWICSIKDLHFAHAESQKLKYLCLDYDIVLTGAHRAINDTLALTALLQKAYKDNLQSTLESALEYSKLPTKEIHYKISFEDKDTFKGLGARWNGQSKTWFFSYKTSVEKSYIEKQVAESGVKTIGAS